MNNLVNGIGMAALGELCAALTIGNIKFSATVFEGGNWTVTITGY